MTGAVYWSPLRPLDIGYLGRHYDVEIDWATTNIGDWTPATRYGFTGELPAAVVDQLSLERPEPGRSR
ncbi:hypothetical protein Q5424_01265 [Conexibacter sp. JD483]|uniref:hypothetical protein n=1 Tax=unclassified Conexibacter TaxID=2627773 RepID=UPI002723F376|nr:MULTISPECIES: hypothetical protein [unclassified Conexibacter]MDO8185858.1 hypothetical protein [Conexibacter sp. CPCC 205706]MDO8198602.1 hypothetical protein [Conexibacter sp. CPCC 205762]MDR9367688.1 hypothetical protein [Conexibacter sp. JD483]